MTKKHFTQDVGFHSTGAHKDSGSFLHVEWVLSGYSSWTHLHKLNENTKLSLRPRWRRRSQLVTRIHIVDIINLGRFICHETTRPLKTNLIVLLVAFTFAPGRMCRTIHADLRAKHVNFIYKIQLLASIASINIRKKIIYNIICASSCTRILPVRVRYTRDPIYVNKTHSDRHTYNMDKYHVKWAYFTMLRERYAVSLV